MKLALIKRIEDKYIPEPNTGCWLWIASLNPQGYGQLSTTKKEGPKGAHRIIYELYKGKIPDGLHLDHLCRMPSCVNPDHLEPVTQRINILRGVSLFAKQFRQTHCKRDHLLGGNNLYIRKNKNNGNIKRSCIECSNMMAIKTRGHPNDSNYRNNI